MGSHVAISIFSNRGGGGGEKLFSEKLGKGERPAY